MMMKRKRRKKKKKKKKKKKEKRKKKLRVKPCLSFSFTSPLYIKECLNLHDHGKICMVKSVLPGPEG